LATPQHPKTLLQSLPLTLRGTPIIPIPNYSKASGVFSSSCRKAASSPPLYFHRANPRDSSQVVIPFVRVWTYQTRNFANRFLYDVLYLHPTFVGARRLVSEDSCELHWRAKTHESAGSPHSWQTRLWVDQSVSVVKTISTGIQTSDVVPAKTPRTWIPIQMHCIDVPFAVEQFSSMKLTSLSC